MPRIRGLERHEAPISVRWAYNYVKKRFGRELTPIKVQARVPAVFWGAGLMEICLRRSGRVEERLHTLVQLRAAARVGCPF